MAFVGSGSALLALRSLKMSALAYGDEDHIIRRRGKVSVNRTILDWMVVDEYVDGGSKELLLDFFGGHLVDALAYDFISATVWKSEIK